MGLRCQCGKPVHFANVNNATAMATCPSCGMVFSTTGATVKTLEAPDAPVIPEAFTAGERFEIQPSTAGYRETARQGGGTRWTYRWFRWWHLLGVPGFVVWLGLVLGGGPGFIRHDGLLWWFLPFAVGLLYMIIAHLFNSSAIELSQAGLSVRSGPIPWRSITRARDGISGFEARGHPWTRPGFGGQNARFEVQIVGSDGRRARLLGDMTVEEANHLASQLNAELRREADG